MDDSYSVVVLSKAVADFPRNPPIIHFPNASRMRRGISCTQQYPQVVTWTQGRSMLGDWRTDLGDVFFEVFSDAGLNVATNPSHLFQREEMARSAEYQIAARLIDFRSSV
jgi:hypothetical protein